MQLSVIIKKYFHSFLSMSENVCHVVRKWGLVQDFTVWFLRTSVENFSSFWCVTVLIAGLTNKSWFFWFAVYPNKMLNCVYSKLLMYKHIWYQMFEYTVFMLLYSTLEQQTVMVSQELWAFQVLYLGHLGGFTLIYAFVRAFIIFRGTINRLKGLVQCFSTLTLFLACFTFIYSLRKFWCHLESFGSSAYPFTFSL